MTILNRGEWDVTTAVTRLRRLGVRVALDDFGTGYAGLALMSAVEIDAIKLGRSIISRLQHDSRARIITRSIFRLCALLGIEVIATGVETQEQLDILRRAKCPQVQGYGLAPPMAPSEFGNWLRAQTPFPQPITMLKAPEGDHASDSYDCTLAPAPQPDTPPGTRSRARRRDTSI